MKARDCIAEVIVIQRSPGSKWYGLMAEPKDSNPIRLVPVSFHQLENGGTYFKPGCVNICSNPSFCRIELA